MKKLVVAATIVLALASAAAATADNPKPVGSPGPLTYAIVGDTPYGAPQIANFPDDVAQINADPAVSLVMHLGDIKNGSTRCDTSYFQQIRTDFDAFADPLVYTPGDNEWTDCHRANNGGYVPTERLATIRQLFFDRPGLTLGQPMQVDHQAAPYVENVAWSAGDVMFGTVNIPGSNDDWLPWFDTTPRSLDQVLESTLRTAADVAWIEHVFFEAKRTQAAAVVLGIQADMWDPAFSGANDDPTQYDHFTPLVQTLAKEAQTFHKPVLLLNGDSHAFADDAPLASSAPAYRLSMYGVSKPVDNLRRITVNGSTTPCHEYLRLHVDATSPAIFSYERVRYANQPGFPASCLS